MFGRPNPRVARMARGSDHVPRSPIVRRRKVPTTPLKSASWCLPERGSQCRRHARDHHERLGPCRLQLRDLVFDDGSQDNTAAVVAAFQTAHPQAPIRLYRNKFNRGLAFNFVEAAFQGRGTYYRAVPGDNVEPAKSNRTGHPRAWDGRCHRSPFRGDSKPTVSAHCHIQALYASRQPGERISAGYYNGNRCIGDLM